MHSRRHKFHKFVTMVKYICSNWQMYLSKLANVFVHNIAKRQNSNTISFYRTQVYLGSDLWVASVWNSQTDVLQFAFLSPLEYMMLLYSNDSALSMCHFSLTFLYSVFSNVFLHSMHEKMHSHTGYNWFLSSYLFWQYLVHMKS